MRAVLIGITLSTYIITASLAMIAALSTVIACIVEHRSSNCLLIIFSCCSFVCFCVSIFWGGKGIDVARKEGAKGNWDINITKKHFNAQALFALIGLVWFILCIVFIAFTPGESSINGDYKNLMQRLEKLEDIVNSHGDAKNKTTSIQIFNHGNLTRGHLATPSTSNGNSCQQPPPVQKEVKTEDDTISDPV